MDAVEIGAFLESHEVGVLAMASGDSAYGIPMSYAYDGSDDALYFRFGYAGDSRKERYLDQTDRASFVVMAEDDGAWRSVVADGQLEVAAKDALDTAVLEAVRELEIPFFDVHAEDPEALGFEIVCLDVSMLAGVEEGITGLQ